MSKLTPLHLHYLKQFCNILAVGIAQAEKTTETATREAEAQMETVALRHFLTHLNQGWEREQSLAAFEQWIAQYPTSRKPSSLLLEPVVMETTPVEQPAVAVSSVTADLPDEPATSADSSSLSQISADTFFATLPWAAPLATMPETTAVVTTTATIPEVATEPTVVKEIEQQPIFAHQTTADFFATLPWTKPLKDENNDNTQTVKTITAVQANQTETQPVEIETPVSLQPPVIESPPVAPSSLTKAGGFFTTLPWQLALAQAPSPAYEFITSQTTASLTPKPSISAGDFFGTLTWLQGQKQQPPITKSSHPSSLESTTQLETTSEKEISETETSERETSQGEINERDIQLPPNKKTLSAPAVESIKNTAEFFATLPWQHVLAQPSLESIVEKTTNNQPIAKEIKKEIKQEQQWLAQYTHASNRAADFFASLPWQAGKGETLHIAPGKTSENPSSTSPTINPILTATQSAITTAQHEAEKLTTNPTQNKTSQQFFQNLPW